MKPELRFETKKMMSSDLGPQACVPDLIGEHILQNDTKFDLGEHDEIYEGFGRKRSAYPYRQYNSYTRELKEKDIKIAVLMLIADMYDNRQLQVDKNIMNKTAETILGMYCVNFL